MTIYVPMFLIMYLALLKCYSTNTPCVLENPEIFCWNLEEICRIDKTVAWD